MSRRTALRLTLDLVMTVLLLLALAYRITGGVLHEWIGVSASALFVVHNAINWRWYRALFKGRYNVRRFLNTVVSLSLLVAMTVLVASGVALSHTLFAFGHHIGDEMFIRQMHAFAAYWSLILIAVHIGMHWDMIPGFARKVTGPFRASCLQAIVPRVLAVLTVAYGVWASFDRNMGSKLLLGYSFDFWDPNRPIFLFFTGNLAIMGLYICATHYALQFLKGFKNDRGTYGDHPETHDHTSQQRSDGNRRE